jgi:hypothetical protein
MPASAVAYYRRLRNQRPKQLAIMSPATVFSFASVQKFLDILLTESFFEGLGSGALSRLGASGIFIGRVSEIV